MPALDASINGQVAGTAPLVHRRRQPRIVHPFLNKFFFTEQRTEFRTEVTEPNPLSAL
jgi:hypothetical protein